MLLGTKYNDFPENQTENELTTRVAFSTRDPIMFNLL